MRAPLAIAAMLAGAGCAMSEACPDGGMIGRVRAVNATHVEVLLQCGGAPQVVELLEIEGLAVRKVAGAGGRKLVLETDAQEALRTYTLRLDRETAEFVGVGDVPTAAITIRVDDRHGRGLTEATARVTIDPDTGVFSGFAATVRLSDPDGDHVWTAELRVAIDPRRTLSTLDDGASPGRQAYAAQAVTSGGAPLTNAVTFEVRKGGAGEVDLPMLSAPRPPGLDALAQVRVRVDDRPSRALAAPSLRVSARADGAWDAAFPTTIALRDDDGDHVWEAIAHVRVDGRRRLGGISSETSPYLVFVRDGGIDRPNVAAQVEALDASAIDATVRVGNPALVPVTFRVDPSRAYLDAEGTLRGLYPGEAVFLTGDFAGAEDAFGEGAADRFSGGENVALQMIERRDRPGLWERTLFVPPSRALAWTAVRCPAGRGCGELNRKVRSSGRAFPTVMKNLATENRDAGAHAAVKIIDPRSPSVRLDDGRTLSYAAAQVHRGGGAGGEPNPAGVPDGVRSFKQAAPDQVVAVGADAIETPVVVVGTWRDVNLPRTAAEILASDQVFDLDPWDYDAGFAGARAPSYPPPAPLPFVIGDGARDARAVAIMGGGAQSMTLHAAIAGRWLYVATETTGGGSDHFVFVSIEPPGVMRPAPWAKAGMVAHAASSIFLAAETSSTFVGWFRLADGSTLAGRADVVASKTGVMEGLVDLESVFGAVPETIYLSVAPYASPDGGAVYPHAQLPVSRDADGDVDADEIAVVPRAAITVISSAPW